MSRPAIEEEWPEYVHLSEQVATLWFELSVYRGLFRKDQATVDLLNRSAPQFFQGLGVVLPLNVLRILSAIFDNPKTGSNANITLEGVIAVARTWLDETEYQRCLGLLSQTTNARGKLRKFRNKRLAHLDRSVLLGFERISGITRGEIEKLAETAAEILNVIQSAMFRSSTSYQNPIMRSPDDILHVIESYLFGRYMQSLLHDGQVSHEQVGNFIEHGPRGGPWYTWCQERQLPVDCYKVG